ncbi:hypothetical protein [Nocardioides donggukensis]|uniref:Uncharacterized protein n=1 Tax=Nocardioides donggukensis TaxID=2774019 RepID=A0A927K2T2_9ACTN|nr:hypothetical protein [Nocardioides donggukensis]MBD8868852.1 hypothetical protein [Nocardioides donggukensis]
MQVEQVQRWVMSALVMVTGLIFAGGLCFLAGATDGAQPGARPGLLVIAAAVGLLTMVGARLIHLSRPVSPWLLVGLLPALVGWWWLYLR